MFSDMLQLVVVVDVYGVLLCVFRPVVTSDGCGCIWSVAVCFQRPRCLWLWSAAAAQPN